MSRKVVGYGMSVVLILAGVFAISPYWSISGLVKAAQNDNPDAVADRVDVERLQQNLKSQILASMQTELTKTSDSGGFAALGAALGTVIVDRTIQAMITPEAISMAIKSGVGETDRSRIGTTVALIGNDAARWLDTSTFRITGDNGVSFTWRRRGFSWRLTSISTPELRGASATIAAHYPSGPSKQVDYEPPPPPMPAREAISSARQLLADGKAMEAYGVAHQAINYSKPNLGERRDLERIAMEAWERQKQSRSRE